MPTRHLTTDQKVGGSSPFGRAKDQGRDQGKRLLSLADWDVDAVRDDLRARDDIAYSLPWSYRRLLRQPATVRLM